MLNLKTNLSITNSPNPPRIRRPVFPKKAKWRCLTPSDITYLNKFKPKMLSVIELTHFEPREMSVQDIRKLSRALKDTKTASSLIIPKTDFYQQNHQQAIRHLLKTTNHWKKLNLDFDFKEEVSQSNDKIFKYLLSCCKNLSTFQIKIAGKEKIANPIVNCISQELHRLPTLKKLQLNLDSSRDSSTFQQEDDSNALLLTFKYPRSLSSLYLDFPRPEFVRSKLLPRFAYAIKRCSLLMSFALSFLKKFYQDINSEMKIIASVSERIHQVYLRKEFNNFQLTEGFAYLEDFRHLRNISTLDLSITYEAPVIIPVNYLNTLYPNLALLKNLKNLTLLFSGFRHPSQAFTHLKSLTKLEKLGFFSVHRSDMTNDPNFIENLAKTLSHFHHLTDLQLHIVFPGLSSQSYAPLFAVLSQLVSLQTLSIDLAEDSAEMTQKSIKTLSHSIAKLNLTSLRLKLGQAQQSEPLFAWLWTTGFDSLFSVLLDFKHLSTLILDLSTFELSPKESKSLGLAIKNLPKLSDLTLKLHQFNAFEDFTDNPKGLTNLCLIFNEDLGDREIGILATKLASFRSLENVHFSFRLKESMSSSGFTFLLLGLANLPMSIKSLKLWISDCWRELDDKKMMSSFFEELVRLKKLESIDITFRDCRRYWRYDEAFEMKIINHQNFPHLQEFVWSENTYL